MLFGNYLTPLTNDEIIGLYYFFPGYCFHLISNYIYNYISNMYYIYIRYIIIYNYRNINSKEGVHCIIMSSTYKKHKTT